MMMTTRNPPTQPKREVGRSGSNHWWEAGECNACFSTSEIVVGKNIVVRVRVPCRPCFFPVQDQVVLLSLT